jgi:hypothetical protein
MAWWQIGTGVFAVVSTVSNFLAAGYLYYKQEQDLAEMIQRHIDEIREENDTLARNNKCTEYLLKEIRERKMVHKK